MEKLEAVEMQIETVKSYLKRKGVNGTNSEEPTEYVMIKLFEPKINDEK